MLSAFYFLSATQKSKKIKKYTAAGYQTKRLRKLTKDIAQLKSHPQNNNSPLQLSETISSTKQCELKYGGTATLVKTTQCRHDSICHYCKLQLGHNSVPNHPPNKK